MAELELTETKQRVAAPAPSGFVDRSGDRSFVDSCRTEVGEYYEILKGYSTEEPDDVLRSLSAVTARLTEMRAMLQRSGSSAATNLRTKEVDPLIDACDTQFKIHSRLVSLRELDWRVAGGSPS